jgi:hypothetical protein
VVFQRQTGNDKEAWLCITHTPSFAHLNRNFPFQLAIKRLLSVIALGHDYTYLLLLQAIDVPQLVAERA